ncbi:sulfatase-like hydrolase/transferase [Halopiger djelfimassiliensis]|uniref:sulfatase-like hydrolase/transferase n=1 Tax=Halopiger djelfimassiliensis TaxID=1293047 RepID=UPI0006780D4D|nr:sulfatase-like hydrolase/transferase [Halopiger djelfimassiliensis]
MADRPNVFVLSSDSLPYSWFENRSQQLAARVNGVNFTDAIAPASFTSSAVPALVTGTYTDEISAWGIPESGGPTPVSEAFTGGGYDCALWTDNYLFGAEYNYDRGFVTGNLGRPSRKKRLANHIKESPLEPAFGLFETLYFNVVQPIQNVGGANESFYRDANELHSRALEWLRDRRSDAPVFCWIHYMDTHHPYQPPSEYIDERQFNRYRSRSELGEFTRNAIKSNGEGLSEPELEDVATAYEACCEYLHTEVTDFVSTLEERGHYDPESDVVVITADHGEILSRDEYGMLGHVPPAFWEDIVRVPLVIGRPDWPESSNDGQVSLVDLKSLLVDAAGLESTPTMRPSELHRERVLMVSEWEERDDGSITTYRGIRSESGRKCFGARREGSDQVICTAVRDHTEKLVWAKSHAVSANDIPTEYEPLYSRLGERGGVIQYDTAAPTVDHGATEDHLRDLGYLD